MRSISIYIAIVRGARAVPVVPAVRCTFDGLLDVRTLLLFSPDFCPSASAMFAANHPGRNQPAADASPAQPPQPGLTPQECHTYRTKSDDGDARASSTARRGRRLFTAPAVNRRRAERARLQVIPRLCARALVQGHARGAHLLLQAARPAPCRPAARAAGRRLHSFRAVGRETAVCTRPAARAGRRLLLPRGPREV